MSPTLFQILMLLLGGGVLVTALTVAFKFGADRATIKDDIEELKGHFQSGGKVDLLWRFFEDGTLHRLRERGVVRENSPLSFTAALAHTGAYGGVPRELYERFLDMVPRAPLDNPAILAFVMDELGWDDIIKKRAAQLGWTRTDYAYQWKIAIEEAQRDGLDVVAEKLKPYVVDA